MGIAYATGPDWLSSLRHPIQSPTTTRRWRARRVIYTRSTDAPRQPTQFSEPLNPPIHRNTHPPTAFGVLNYTSLFVDLIVVWHFVCTFSKRIRFVYQRSWYGYRYSRSDRI